MLTRCREFPASPGGNDGGTEVRGQAEGSRNKDCFSGARRAFPCNGEFSSPLLCPGDALIPPHAKEGK